MRYAVLASLATDRIDRYLYLEGTIAAHRVTRILTQPNEPAPVFLAERLALGR